MFSLKEHLFSIFGWGEPAKRVWLSCLTSVRGAGAATPGRLRSVVALRSSHSGGTLPRLTATTPRPVPPPTHRNTAVRAARGGVRALDRCAQHHSRLRGHREHRRRPHRLCHPRLGGHRRAAAGGRRVGAARRRHPHGRRVLLLDSLRDVRAPPFPLAAAPAPPLSMQRRLSPNLGAPRRVRGRVFLACACAAPCTRSLKLADPPFCFPPQILLPGWAPRELRAAVHSPPLVRRPPLKGASEARSPRPCRLCRLRARRSRDAAPTAAPRALLFCLDTRPPPHFRQRRDVFVG